MCIPNFYARIGIVINSFIGDSDTSANNEPDEDNTKKDLSDDDSDNESNSQSPGCVDGKASSMSNGAPFTVSFKDVGNLCTIHV